MSSGLSSGVSGLALGAGLYRDVSGLWSGASGLIDGFGGAFSPASLFAASEPGGWYDPSDLTTLFQDSAGTTPVTAPGQTVGLWLDKSQGLVLGAELVTSAWVNSGSVPFDTFSASGGGFSATKSVTGTQQQAYAGSFSVTIGKLYYFEAVVSANTINSVWFDISTGTTMRSNALAIATGASTVRGFFTPTSTQASANLRVVTGSSAAGSISVTSVTVRELPGNHLSQSSSGQRAIYGIEPVGGRRNLLTYTEQFDNAAWSKTGAPLAAVTPDVATAPDGTTTADRLVANAGRIQQSITLAATDYVFSCYMKADAGSVGELWLAGATGRATFNLSTGTVATTTSGNASIIDAGNGWYRCVVVGTSAAGSQSIIIDEAGSGILIWGAQLEAGSTATAYQRVVTAFDVTEAGVPSLSYLQFDGSDDWLVSPTITPGIDKAQVFAGVRKLSDAAGAILVESSVSYNANNGSFYLSAPNDTATQRYGAISRGSLPTNVNQGSYVTGTGTAPDTAVLAATYDISGDQTVLRRNGTGFAAGTADQGTGNFLAYPLYVGRRGGTTLPYNGRIYSLIVRFGANLSASTITQTENWVAGKTGIYTLDQLNRLNAQTADGTLYSAYAASDANSNNYLVNNTVLAADGTSYNVI